MADASKLAVHGARLPQPRYDERRHGPDPDRRRLAAQPCVAAQSLPIRDGDRREVGRAARADAGLRAEPRPDDADDHAARHRARDRPGRASTSTARGASTSASATAIATRAGDQGRARRGGAPASPAARATRRGSSTRSQTFDREPTGNWGPGAPRVLPQRERRSRGRLRRSRRATRVPQRAVATQVPQVPYVPQASRRSRAAAPTAVRRRRANPELRKTPMPRARAAARRGRRRSRAANRARLRVGLRSAIGGRAARAGAAGVGAARSARRPRRAGGLHHRRERATRLNALGEQRADRARDRPDARHRDAVAFMEELTRKLEQLRPRDLIEPGDAAGGEPTYRMRR